MQMAESTEKSYDSEQHIIDKQLSMVKQRKSLSSIQ